MSVKLRTLTFVATAAAFIAFVTAAPAQCATVAWTDWTQVTAGNPGSGTGTIALSPTITVSYSGQTNGILTDYPSWSPASTFSGGTVSNPPPASDNSVQLTGGVSTTNTITFSSPVTDPVMAIWSLGAGGASASFVFTASEPFTLEAGGPSAEYGGSSITVSGNTVSGAEGNGVIQFNGTFSSLRWTNPLFENYYAFTVGVAGAATTPVPEPSEIALLVMGLGSFVLYRRRASRRLSA